MSDHNVDESGTNRTWLCVVLLIVAIGIAAVANKAAPRAAEAKPSSRIGILITKDGAVRDGTLLVRGAGWGYFVSLGAAWSAPRSNGSCARRRRRGNSPDTREYQGGLGPYWELTRFDPSNRRAVQMIRVFMSDEDA